jgi:hypothetical protein
MKETILAKTERQRRARNLGISRPRCLSSASGLRTHGGGGPSGPLSYPLCLAFAWDPVDNADLWPRWLSGSMSPPQVGSLMVGCTCIAYL